MRPGLRISLTISAALCLAFGICINGYAQSLFPSPFGEQKVLVIVCQYRGSQAPRVSGPAWAAALNQQVNPFYGAATGNQTAFSFSDVGSLVGSPGVVPLPYTYQDTTMGGAKSPFPPGGLGIFDNNNDPAIMFREVRDALDGAEQIAPARIGIQFSKIMVVLNGPKRGRAVGVYPYMAQLPTGGRKLVQLSVYCVSEPTNGVISTAAMSVAAHELGHTLGLPDLYNERSLAPVLSNIPGYSPAEFTESWCMMAFDNLQGFSGYSRWIMGWVKDNRIVKFSPPPPNRTINATVSLKPANSSSQGSDRELLMLAFNPLFPSLPRIGNTAPPFQGYIVEARKRTGPDSSLPAAYEEGVLISYAKPALSGLNFPPLQPLVVSPRAANPPLTSGNRSQLVRAAFNAGTGSNVFTDPANGITLTVNSIASDGTANLSLRWVDPPRPDVGVTHSWLDSPTNGFGTFVCAMGPNGIPTMFGDPVGLLSQVNWDHVGPVPVPVLPPVITTVTHRLHFRVTNSGNAPAVGVRGSVYLFRPQLPVSVDLSNPATLASLNPIQTFRNVDFEDIPIDGESRRSIEFQPAGPFVAVLLLDRTGAQNGVQERNLANNFFLAGYVVTQTSPGSPYAPIKLRYPIINADPMGHVVLSTVSGLPGNWDAKIGVVNDEQNRLYAALARRDESVFEFTAQPADPGVDKPGRIKALELVGWMDVADSWAPVSKLPLYVMMNYRTGITVEVKAGKAGDAIVTGSLVYKDADGAFKPVKGVPLVVTVSPSNGPQLVMMPGSPGHTAVTNANGRFQQSVTVDPRARIAVTVQFGGTIDYGASQATIAPPTAKN